jgi:pimeloyl-ACP methyl ester carboxylesterase
VTPGNKGRLAAAIALPFLLMHHSPAHAAPAPAAIAAPMTMEHISVTATGKGTPVILIPGLSSPRAVWDGVVPDLAKTHRVYVVQVNGFGGDDPKGNLKPGILDGVVADLHAFVVREKLGTPAVVGHSLGGLVGLMLARAHPQDLSRLMVVDALPFYGMLFGPTATVAMIQPRAAAMRDGIAMTYGKPADPAPAEQLAHTLALKPESRARVKAWVMASDARVSAEAMYEDLSTDLRPDMAAIRTPITLVYPWSVTGPDKAGAEALYKGAYAQAPHVTYVDIGDARHFVMLDQPAAFAAALGTFADAG